MDKHDKLTTLTTVNDEMHASVIVTTLNDKGIKAKATGGFTAGFRAEAPGYVDVVVSEKDLTEAKRILESIDFENEAVDWSDVDVGNADS